MTYNKNHSLEELLDSLYQKALTNIEEAAKSRDSQRVKKYSRLLEEVENLKSRLGSVKSSTVRLTEIFDVESTEIDHQDTETDVKLDGEVSKREKGNQKRTDFLRRLEMMGIHLVNIGSRKHTTATGGLVGMAYASERHAHRWWLGLPMKDYEAIVLLCEDRNERVLSFILPKELYADHIKHLSLVNGQRKFNIVKDNSEFYLLIPKREKIEITPYLDAFDSLRS